MADYVSSGFSQRNRHGRTQARRSAGDQRGLAAEPELIEDQGIISTRCQSRSRLAELRLMVRDRLPVFPPRCTAIAQRKPILASQRRFRVDVSLIMLFADR